MEDNRRHTSASPPTVITKAITNTLDDMNPVQRMAVWWTGFVLFAGPVARIIVQDWLNLLGEHGHEDWKGLALEMIGSGILSTIGLCIIIPPLGIWLVDKIVNNIPLPKNWKRREDRRV